MVPHVVQGADVRMIEPRDDACLALEASSSLRIRGEIGRQHLDGHEAVEARVARLVDLSHAAGCEKRDDLIGAQPRADGKARGRRDLLARIGREARGPVHFPQVRGAGEKCAGLGPGGEERVDVAAEIAVADAGLLQEGLALLGRAFEHGAEDVLDALPAISLHRFASPERV